MNNFKNKRDEYLAEIKRRKKQEILTKARTVNSLLLKKKETNNCQYSHEVVSKLEEMTFDGSEIGKLLETAYSSNELESFYGFVGIYKLLCSDIWKIRTAEALVTTPNITSYLIEQSKNKPIVSEIIFVLSFEFLVLEAMVVEKYGIPMLIELATSIKDSKSLKSILWAISNLACDSTVYRDRFLESNSVRIILRMAYAENVEEIYEVMISVLLQLCSKVPLPNFELIEPALPIIFSCMKFNQNPTQRNKALRVIVNNISDPRRRSKFLGEDVISVSIEYLNDESLSDDLFSQVLTILLIALRENSEMLHSVPEYISVLLRSIKKRSEAIKIRICYLVKETLIKFPEQIGIILKNPIFIESLFSLGYEGNDHDISRLVTGKKYLFALVVQKVEINQWKELKERGVFQILEEGLDSSVKEEDLVLLTLRGIANLMLIDPSLLNEGLMDKVRGFINPKTLGINHEVTKILNIFQEHREGFLLNSK